MPTSHLTSFLLLLLIKVHWSLNLACFYRSIPLLCNNHIFPEFYIHIEASYSWAPILSDLTYLSILFPGRFHLGRGCLLAYHMGKRFLHLAGTFGTRLYCFLAYTVLIELM